MLNIKTWAAVAGLAALVVGSSGCGTFSNAVAASTKLSTTTAHHHVTPSKKKPARPIKKKSHGVKPVSLAPLTQPTPQKPLKVLVIGDSLAEDLQYGLMDVAGSHSSLKIIPAAYGSSGLINTAFYNWPKMLALDLKRYHPQLVYMMLGANDSYSFYQNGRAVVFGTPYWRQVYGGRANGLIAQAQRAGAHVIWVGEPIMSWNSVLSNPKMQTMNALFSFETKRHPAIATFIPTWKLFQNAQGSFTEYMTDSAGLRVMVRDPDGVHIAPPAGDELLASYLLYRTEQLEKVSLCVTGSDLWTQYPLHACPAP